MPGPRPKPRPVKALKGTLRGHRESNAPEPESSIPDPPAHLGEGLEDRLVHPRSGTVHVAGDGQSVCGRLDVDRAEVTRSNEVTCKLCRAAAADGTGRASVALAAWWRLAPLLADQGLMAEDYRDGLAAYCEALSTWVEAKRVVREKGMVFTSPNGHLCQRPEVGIMNKAAGEMRRWMIEFGLTPAARGKVEAIELKEKANRFASVRGGKAG